MQRNLKLEIEYDGIGYCGWQIQNRHQPPAAGHKSIQGTIEKALRKILREKVCLIVSGRTDAGVHALAQVANFKTNSKITADRLQLALNGILPKDICIKSVKAAKNDFHSRFSAKSKTYRYNILNRKFGSPLLRDTVHLCHYPLDLKLMRKEARSLLGRHNFKSFQASGKKEKNPVKNIKKIQIRKKGDLIRIDIEADGFLYNMARNIAGTLIEIGRGRFSQGSLKRILLAKDRRCAGPTAPAKGLVLLKVGY